MRAIGIDLGTTNSVAAIGGVEHKVLASQDNEVLTPSVVGYVRRRNAAEGEIVVGRQALNNAVRDPNNTIFSVKRLMGRVYGEQRVQEVQSRFHYRLAEPSPGSEDQGIKILLNDEPYTPTDISALILRHVKKGAELALGEEVTHAVITVPAYFEERQRKATADAGAAAGLKVLEIIDEPTAAAIAFGIKRENERHRVLVYDMGGGTFDISIIQMTGGQYTVMTTAGNNWMGGDDFNMAIVRRMIEQVKEEYGHDPSSDLAFLTKAKIEAERAKIALSAQQSYVISAPLIVRVPHAGGPMDLELEITRQMFEDDIRALVEESLQLVRSAMQDQHLEPSDITEVLLVGGSTAVPLIQQEMHALFGQSKVKRHVNPMECVALGAGALAAGKLLEQTPAAQPDAASTAAAGPRVQGVTAMHLGIAAVKGDNPDAFIPVIPKNTPYPLTEPKKRLFYPSEDNQTLINIPVYEGLNERASLNEQQGIISFPLPHGVAMSTGVEVSFNYDSNRVTTVSVRIIGTDQQYTETLKRDRARVQTASKNLVDDWRETLQPSIQAANHFVETYGAYMSAEDKQEILDAVKDGEAALKQGNESVGQKVILVLRNKILGSGTASLLFIAARTMQGLPPDRSQLMAQAVASLRSAHTRGDMDAVDRLSGELRVVVAQLMSQRAGVRDVEDRRSWEGLLRVAAG
jgi:molecular chaperone DnaK